jgi:hypothetical protein
MVVVDVGRSVWIFARPLQFATIFGSQFVSHGKFPFCHWGMLITELDVDTVKELLTEHDMTTEDSSLGEMWELFRRENDSNEIDVTRPFKLSDVGEDWNLFSAEPLGMTTLNNEQIEDEGIF